MNRRRRLRSHRNWRGALLGLALAACGYNPDNYILDSAKLDQALQLSAETLGGAAVTALPADGFSRVTIRVRVDSQAPSTRRTLLFSTTAGTFLGGSGTEPLTRKVTVGSDGRGSLQLMSNKTAQAVVVTATVESFASVARTLELQFVPPVMDSIVRFTLVPGILPANGLATGEVNVMVSPYLSGDAGKVQLDLAGGTVTPAGLATPDASGKVRAFISSSRVGPARLAVTAAGFTRDTVVQFRQPAADEILRFTEVPGSVVADGATLGLARVMIPAGLTGALRDVQFELVGGTIQGNAKVTPTAAGQATVLFLSAQTGTGTLRATAAGFSIDTLVQFTPAPPDSVFVGVGAGTVKTGENLALTATLFRIKGTTTLGTLVKWQAFDAQNVEQGRFTNVLPSNAGGTASATWVASGVTAPSTIRIVATATAYGKSGSATVTVTP